jgi:hypothetical protein
MKYLITLLAGALIVAALVTFGSGAQAVSRSGAYTLEWSAISGGGGIASGGSYTVLSTIGQAEAGRASGGGYSLVGAFAGGVDGPIPQAPKTPVYLPLVRR